MTKLKSALIAAFVLGSASAALAQASGEELQNSAYLRNPSAPVPMYQQEAFRAPQASFVDREVLIEGRNVALGTQNRATAPYSNPQPIESFGGY